MRNQCHGQGNSSLFSWIRGGRGEKNWISNVQMWPDLQAIREPFSDAYYFGEERISKRFCQNEVMPNATYSDVKAFVEQPFEGKLTFIGILGSVMFPHTEMFEYSINTQYKLLCTNDLWNYF